MKNWAIVIDVAIVAAVGSVAKNSVNTATTKTAVVAGASAAIVFGLRFFIRAVICYINLLRWNSLQRAIASSWFLQEADQKAEKVKELRREIQSHYFEWCATISRKEQLLANLKLGFTPLLAFPAAVLVYGASTGWHLPFVEGLTVLAVGATLIELIDFLTSKEFDDAAAYARRKAKGDTRSHFPKPVVRALYPIGFLFVVVLSGFLSASTRPVLTGSYVRHTLARLRSLAAPADTTSGEPEGAARAVRQVGRTDSLSKSALPK